MVTVKVEMLICVVVTVKRSASVCVTVTDRVKFWPMLKEAAAAMIVTTTNRAATVALSPLFLRNILALESLLTK